MAWYGVGSAFPMSARCALLRTVKRCRPSSSNTGTSSDMSAGCELPSYGELCRNASPGARSGWRRRMLAAIRSGPLSTCTGMLSAMARNSSRPVITQHEKSRPVLRMTERPVRMSVLDMLRTIAVKRDERTARSTGSDTVAGSGDIDGLLALDDGVLGARRDQDRAARPADGDGPAIQHDGGAG